LIGFGIEDRKPIVQKKKKNLKRKIARGKKWRTKRKREKRKEDTAAKRLELMN